MKVRLFPRVKFREEKFGGTCYVPERDDIFAANHEVFGLLKDIRSTWAQVPKPLEPAYRRLAALGLCETEPSTAEISYSGPSLLGKFEEFPSIEEPLVVNCFSTAHCPLRCIYCHADDLMGKAARDAETDPLAADLANVAATASAFSNLVAVITGGDPLTRPARTKVLMEALVASRKALVLDTSGVGDIDALLPLLRKHHVHVRVSLDAAGPTNDKLRPINRNYISEGQGSDLAKNTIRSCLANDIPVTVQTVVTSKNDQYDELGQLRDWLVANRVKHWVLHIAVEAGKAREFQRRVRNNQTRQRPLLSTEDTTTKTLRRLILEENQASRIDIRVTDTNPRPNSVILIDSFGNLQTEGFAHIGKVRLFDARAQRPDLIRAKWVHIDSFGHAVRYLNWNRWLYPDESIENLCYDVPIPVAIEEEHGVIENEVKFKVLDAASLRAGLVKLGWLGGPELFQRDEYFDTKSRFLETSDFAIRVRTENKRIMFAFKGPRIYEQNSSSRVEIELSISSRNYHSELKDSGLHETWALEKKRTTYQHPKRKLTVVVDEVPEIGWFAELEGPSDEAIEVLEALRDSLGSSERLNYADLYRAYKEQQGVARSQITGARFTED